MDNKVIIYIFALFSFAAIVFYYLYFIRIISKINKVIKDTNEYLTISKNNVDILNDFSEIDNKLKDNTLIGNIWLDFRKSLTTYTNSEGTQKLYSINNANEYFSFSYFTRELNMPFWQSYGGIFTGLGILGTFGGLTIGLYGIDVTSSDINVLKEGISGLLSGIQYAFITSLIGILVGLFYGFIHNLFISNLKQNIKLLCETIEIIFPRKTAEQWLANQYETTQDQNQTLKNLSEDVARELGNVLGNQIDDGISELCKNLDEQMKPVFEKLYLAINELTNSGTNTLGQAISDKTGAQLDNFATLLQDMQTKLEENIDSSKQISENINNQMLETVNKIGDILLQGANDVANKQRESMIDMQKQLMEITHFVNSSSDKILSSITQTNEISRIRIDNSINDMQNMNHSIMEGFEQFSKQNTENLMTTTNNVQTIITNSFNAFNDLLNNHRKTIQDTFDKMQTVSSDTGKLLEGIKDTTQKLADAGKPIQTATDNLNNQISWIRTESANMYTLLNSQLTTLTDANNKTTNNINNLMNGLKINYNQIENAWIRYESNFNKVGGEIEKATDIITDRLQKYNEMMNSGMKESLRMFDKSVTNATGALKSIAEELGDDIKDLQKYRSR